LPIWSKRKGEERRKHRTLGVGVGKEPPLKGGQKKEERGKKERELFKVDNSRGELIKLGVE